MDGKPWVACETILSPRWMIFCYLLVRVECSKEEGKNHVCFTRIFEIEREREGEGWTGRIIVSTIGKRKGERAREWRDIDAGEGRKLARRSSKRASLVVSWDIFNTPVSVIHRTVVFLRFLREVESKNRVLAARYLKRTKEFFISRVYLLRVAHCWSTEWNSR